MLFWSKTKVNMFYRRERETSHILWCDYCTSGHCDCQCSTLCSPTTDLHYWYLIGLHVVWRWWNSLAFWDLNPCTLTDCYTRIAPTKHKHVTCNAFIHSSVSPPQGNMTVSRWSTISFHVPDWITTPRPRVWRKNPSCRRNWPDLCTRSSWAPTSTLWR